MFSARIDSLTGRFEIPLTRKSILYVCGSPSRKKKGFTGPLSSVALCEFKDDDVDVVILFLVGRQNSEKNRWING